MQPEASSEPGLSWETLLDRVIEGAGQAASVATLLAYAERLLSTEAETARLALGSAGGAGAVPDGHLEVAIESPVPLVMVVPGPAGPGATRFLRAVAGLLAAARAGAQGAAAPLGEAADVRPGGEGWVVQLLDTVNAIVWEAPIGRGGWSHASGGAVRLLGYPAEVWGRPSFWRQIVHPDDRARVAEHSGAVRGDRVLEYRLLGVDGRAFWFQDAVRLVRNAEGQVIGQRGVMLDITGRAEAEAARERASTELMELQKIECLGLMAGGIAHDFNNLLTVILGNASLAAVRLPEHSSARSCIDDLIANAQRASELTRQLVSYAGRSQLVTETVAFGACLRELHGLLAASVPRGCRFEVDIDRTPLLVEADRLQLQQVAVNLVANAGEALAGRSGAVRVAAFPETLGGPRAESLRLPPGEYVVLTVTDEGAGMDEATRRRIFDPFFSTRRSGRGLGLAVVHGIVRAHRGAIEVNSFPGAGTTVRVFLPASASGAPALKAPSVPMLSGSGLVLVIDDETEVRATARAMLEALGYDVIEAEDGGSGLMQFDRHRETIAAVLLDMTMPVMSGEQVYLEMRRRSPTVPVVLSTGFSRVEARRSGAVDGLDGFLQKPYTVRQLGEVIGRCIAERRKQA